MLTNLIRIVPPSRPDSPEPEDIFASAPDLIFGDLRTEHGDAASTIVYTSSRFGDVELRMADPEGESERRLFGHYLWNASIKLAELISEDEGCWRVQGERVLEFGSGVGLGGIVAALAGAEEVSSIPPSPSPPLQPSFITQEKERPNLTSEESKVTLSDYPSPPLLSNLSRNLLKAQPSIPVASQPHCTVQPHCWGDLTTAFATSQKHHYTRLLAADCLWMPEQHLPLVQSMLHFLTLSSEGRIFCLAGFHTGRAMLAGFFEVVREQGLVVEEIYEEDVEGRRRAWREMLDEGVREDVFERKRWLVVARLRRGP